MLTNGVLEGFTLLYTPHTIDGFFLADHSILGQRSAVGNVSAADTYLTADPGVASSFPAGSHTFVVIDHEIISTAIFLPSADPRRVVVSYKRRNVHKVLVNC